MDPVAVAVTAEVEEKGHLGGNVRRRERAGPIERGVQRRERRVDKTDHVARMKVPKGREDALDMLDVGGGVEQRELTRSAARVTGSDENADRIGASESRRRQGRREDGRSHPPPHRSVILFTLPVRS
jgi:hypothetical protein